MLSYHYERDNDVDFWENVNRAENLTKSKYQGLWMDDTNVLILEKWNAKRGIK